MERETVGLIEPKACEDREAYIRELEDAIIEIMTIQNYMQFPGRYLEGAIDDAIALVLLKAPDVERRESRMQNALQDAINDDAESDRGEWEAI